MKGVHCISCQWQTNDDIYYCDGCPQRSLIIHQHCVHPSVVLKVDLHLLEASHAVQDVELLPAFGEVDLPVNEVGVPEVDKGQVLENKTPGRRKSHIRGVFHHWKHGPCIKLHRVCSRKM